MQFMLRLKEYLRASRTQLESDLGIDPKRQYFSPAYYSQYRVTLPLLQRAVRGRLIDLGCGAMPYRQFLESLVTQYDSLEFFPSSAAVTYVGDIQNMTMIADSAYDTAICLEVLEHVPHPLRALDEICRILKPGGVFIVSVPHLSRLHMEPNDFFRFTQYGLRRILEDGGFDVSTLKIRGGLFSFIGNQVSTLLLGLCWRIPIVKDLAWFLNGWLITRPAVWLDGLLDPSGVYAMGYTAVAARRGPDSRPVPEPEEYQ